MPTAIDLSKAAQEQILAAVKQSQDVALAGVELWAKSITQLTAQGKHLPFTGEVPTPEQLVANTFGFAEKLLAAQKDFAQKVVAATAPIFPTVTKPTDK